MGNWDFKTVMRDRATSHMESCDTLFHDEIKAAVENSIVYGGPDRAPSKTAQPLICVNSAYQIYTGVIQDLIHNLPENAGKTAVLNFASYKNPGGRFLDGSTAQEEILCHHSILYNVLREFNGYYSWNQGHLNKGLYEDRAIYTPNCLFVYPDKFVSVDVLTCAAPNKNAQGMQKKPLTTPSMNRECLAKRVEFIRDIFIEQGVNTAILGAWGCGVFKQNPYEVAQEFVNKFLCANINIIYAIPEGTNYKDKQNYLAFYSVLNTQFGGN